jgi:SAM-dependent methyltransferase
MNDRQLLGSVRRTQGALTREAARFVLGNLYRTSVRRTRHFQEWFRCPMNYARIMELPLTMLMLRPSRADHILDVSSPKLLSLCLARWGCHNVVASDMEDYFIPDFDIYKNEAGIRIETAVFDATKSIPYAAGHFDKAFSVSVLEHIPEDGDRQALSQILRVLKSSGDLVITLPAFSRYVEEWIPAGRLYWKTAEDAQGKAFYQRRYDRDALHARLSVPEGRIEEVVLIAEKPVEPPHLSDDGMMLHNSYFIDDVFVARCLRAVARRLPILPFADYFAEDVVSWKSHYLTTDWSDPNIRQVVVRIKKSASSAPRAVRTPSRAL